MGHGFVLLSCHFSVLSCCGSPRVPLARYSQAVAAAACCHSCNPPSRLLQFLAATSHSRGAFWQSATAHSYRCHRLPLLRLLVDCYVQATTRHEHSLFLRWLIAATGPSGYVRRWLMHCRLLWLQLVAGATDRGNSLSRAGVRWKPILPSGSLRLQLDV